MRTGAAVGGVVVLGTGVAYFVGRKKAKDKGFSNSEFLATIFGVPYRKKGAVSAVRMNPKLAVMKPMFLQRGAPLLSASPYEGKSCQCRNAAGEWYESIKDANGNCICQAGYSHVTRGASYTPPSFGTPIVGMRTPVIDRRTGAKRMRRSLR